MKVRERQSQGGSVQFYCCSPWSDPTLRTASALGNGLKSKTGTMRMRAKAGRGDWLIVSAGSHCSMGKASILSGEGAFLQGRGQRRVALLQDLAKPAELVSVSSVNYYIVSSVTARNLYGAIKTRVLK